jgi:uncharacterized protein (TIGR02271 family)
MTYTDRGRTTTDLPRDLVFLSEMDDYEVARHEIDPTGWDLFGASGDKIGSIKDLIVARDQERAYLALVDTGGWFQNRLYAIPLDCIEFNADDEAAYCRMSKDDFERAPELHRDHPDFRGQYDYWLQCGGGAIAGGGLQGSRGGTEYRDRTTQLGTDTRAESRRGEVRVPLTEERAEVHRETRETGHVGIRKETDVETKHISEPVRRTRAVAEVRDVDDHAAYDHPGATTLREGETLRVPIVEEDVHVEKVPRVNKEVVLRTETDVEQVERDVELRKERVEFEEEGDVNLQNPNRPGRWNR